MVMALVGACASAPPPTTSAPVQVAVEAPETARRDREPPRGSALDRLRARLPVDEAELPVAWLRSPEGQCIPFWIMPHPEREGVELLVRSYVTAMHSPPGHRADAFRHVAWEVQAHAESIVLRRPRGAHVTFEGGDQCVVELPVESFAAGPRGCQTRAPLDLGDCRAAYEAYQEAVGRWPVELSRRLQTDGAQVWWIADGEDGATCEDWTVQAGSPNPEHAALMGHDDYLTGVLVRVEDRNGRIATGRGRRFQLDRSVASFSHILPWEWVNRESTGPTAIVACSPPSTLVVEEDEESVSFASGERWFFSQAACHQALVDSGAVDPDCAH